MFSPKTEELLLEQLQESGLITERDVAHARGAQKGDESLLETLTKTGVINDEQIAQTVAVNSGMEYVDLHGYTAHQGLKDLVPLEVAMRYKVAPLGADGPTLQLVVSDPYDFETLDALPHILQPDIEFFCSTPSLIKTLMANIYGNEAVMGSGSFKTA
ncbi:MAG: type II/IV secretion system protein, partial [Verrucomicrobiales bacterium]|nr:type II/IV secretion system protein [Verrucomicrobiales bacterium]